jgi:3-hydroxyacyl-CoA dehydrogenase/enoyl-CoA hydratase/3-hydroxybutyryl-CoA epimerase
MKQAVTWTIGDDGVAILRLDLPGESVNKLNDAFAAGLAEAMAEVIDNDDIRAAVIISAKKDFIVGADIDLLSGFDTREQGEEGSHRAQAQMQQLADCAKPVVAAIRGNCLGGGLELALACHARVAADDDATRLGLPEVQLGLLPGAGGTQRLPRMIGIAAALDLMLTGKQVRARKARKLGMIDELVPEPLLERAAVELATTLADRVGTEDHPSPLERLRGALGHLLSTDDLQEMVLEDNPIGRKVLFDQGRKKLLSKTRGNYPAPEKILDVVRIGMSDGFEAGLEAEARAFGELLLSPEAQELIGIFLATQALKKDRGTDADVEPRPVHKIGMMGAGLMGAGIAYVTAANAGIPVRLKDVDHEGVGKGLAYVQGILDGRVKRKRMSGRRANELMALVSPTLRYSGLRDAEVVIEAVFEDLDLKHRILREVEANAGPETIFASNTSTLPIAKIAEASKRPETVIGMHYFSPVHKMPLLEVIVTDKTADWVTATCVELGKKQGKTVIVVHDGPGFYTSRILGPYMNEAFHVLAEGVPVEVIDQGLLDFGFPVGPVKLLDEVGIDVAQKAGGVMQKAFGERIDAPPGIDRLVASGRLGRKNGRGFYLYGDANKRGKKAKGVDESVYGDLGIEPKKAARPGAIDREAIAIRCALQMVNEAAHCFGEGILRSARDGDIGAIFGLGFPPFRGGPFRFADALGIGQVVDRLHSLETEHGRRFAPAPVLVDLARRGARFHQRGTHPGQAKATG